MSEEMLWRAGRFCWDLRGPKLVMGILNVTVDSFSDGGRFAEVEAAVAHGNALAAEGAAILDIGGESTRPGAAPVSVDEELKRVIPVIERLRDDLEVALSIDTSKAEVARAALEAGADIINDVSGFRSDEMVEVCAGSACGMVSMHMKGRPRTMQNDPTYGDVVTEIRDSFKEGLERLKDAGIQEERILFDPGIGFGKTVEHNLELLRRLEELKINGRPVLMGLSRKSFIGKVLEREDMELREAPTVALTAYTAMKGAWVHRVHAVAENLEGLRSISKAQAP